MSLLVSFGHPQERGALKNDFTFIYRVFAKCMGVFSLRVPLFGWLERKAQGPQPHFRGSPKNTFFGDSQQVKPTSQLHFAHLRSPKLPLPDSID